MAKYPLTVKSFRRMIDGIVDNTMEALKKFNRVAEEGQKLTAGGPFEVQGTFGADAEGEVGIVISLMTPTVPLEAGGEAAVSVEREWDRNGKSDVKFSFECRVEATKQGESP